MASTNPLCFLGRLSGGYEKMCTASLFASLVYRGLNINCCCNVMRKTRFLRVFIREQYPLKRRIRDEKTLCNSRFCWGGVQLPCLPDFFSAGNKVSVRGRVTKAILGCLKQPYPKHYSTPFTWESSLEEIKVKVFNLFYWHLPRPPK